MVKALIIHLLVITAAVYLTVALVSGVDITGGFMTMFLVALVWAVVITVIKPIVQILALPATVMTLGLFYFVVNALLFWAMEFVVPGFSVDGFLPALLGSVALSAITWLILKVVPE